MVIDPPIGSPRDSPTKHAYAFANRLESALARHRLTLFGRREAVATESLGHLVCTTDVKSKHA